MKPSHLLLSLVLALFAFAARAAPRVYKSVPATPVFYRELYLTPGTYTFYTANPSPGTDTVMEMLGRTSATFPNPIYNLGYSDDAPGLGLMSRMTVVINHADIYQLIVHSWSESTAGQADVFQNGTALGYSAEIGGAQRVVDQGDFRYQTALQPNGTNDTLLFAVGADGKIFGSDDDGGVGLQSELTTLNAAKLIIGAYSKAGPTTLYTNDYTNDADGDGLGYALETELGTCDRNSSTVCTPVFNKMDSDRDGLADTYEVLGKDDALAPQYLPAWGADPRHKDVFVEVDNYPGQAPLVINAADANRVQSFWMNDAPADHVVNIDGLPGVRVHLDIQIPSDPSQPYPVYGNWGGSNTSTTTDYSTAPDNTANFNPIRRGIFRHALFDKSAYGGQTAGMDRSGWGSTATDHGMHTFVHEMLGHGFGLKHHGHDSWGAMNCKPQYNSIMSYAYGGPSTKFSQGLSGGGIDPSNVSEAGPFSPSSFGAVLGGWPFNFLVDASTSPVKVDWNRDGILLSSAYSIRAAVTWAKDLGCAAFLANRQALRNNLPIDSTGPTATPDLVRHANRLYAFFVDTDKRLYYYHGAIGGADSQGSCPGGSEIGKNCIAWSAPVRVPTVNNVAGFSTLQFGTGVMVAYRVPTTNQLQLIQAASTDASGALVFGADRVLGATTTIEPELGDLVTSSGEIAALFYAEGGVHKSLTIAGINGAIVFQGVVTNTSGVALASTTLGASVATFPNRTPGVALPSFARTCAIFPASGNKLAFYCYDKASGRWSDLSATMPACPNPGEICFPGGGCTTTCLPIPVATRPALQYHTDRTGGGSALTTSGARGRFYLAFTWGENIGGIAYAKPKYLQSSTLDSTTPPSAAMSWPTFGNIGDDWTYVTRGSGMSLFEDNATSAPKAIWMQDMPPCFKCAMTRHLWFMPLMDGAPKTTLKDGSDFKVMERGICRGLQGDIWCGSPSTSRWGY